MALRSVGGPPTADHRHDPRCRPRTCCVCRRSGPTSRPTRSTNSLRRSDLHVARTDPVFYSGQSFGNAVLSRWPSSASPTNASRVADGSPSHRRIVAALVDTPFGPWPIASTHLDHRFDRSADRQAQIRHLMELARDWRGDPDDRPAADRRRRSELRARHRRGPDGHRPIGGCRRDRVLRRMGAGRGGTRPHVAPRLSVLGRLGVARPAPRLPARVVAAAQAGREPDSGLDGRPRWHRRRPGPATTSPSSPTSSRPTGLTRHVTRDVTGLTRHVTLDRRVTASADDLA